MSCTLKRLGPDVLIACNLAKLLNIWLKQDEFVFEELTDNQKQSCYLIISCPGSIGSNRSF